MKKLLYLIQLTIFATLFSNAVFADRDDWDRGDHHHWHHGHHGWGHHNRHHDGYGYQPQVNNYYPQPNYYYQAPQQAYYPPQPQYQQGYGYNDNRSHQGLAGGVVGTVFGYELGNGDPLAAGLGAAAGSFLGNGAGWRY